MRIELQPLVLLDNEKNSFSRVVPKADIGLCGPVFAAMRKRASRLPGYDPGMSRGFAPWQYPRSGMQKIRGVLAFLSAGDMAQ